MYHIDKLKKFTQKFAKHVTNNSLLVEIKVMQEKMFQVVTLEKAMKLNHPDILKEIKNPTKKPRKIL